MWEIEVIKELETMPFDKAFEVGPGRWELCHATGRAVAFKGDLYYCIEYVDSDGNLWYGR